MSLSHTEGPSSKLQHHLWTDTQTILLGLVQTAGKSDLFLKSGFEHGVSELSFPSDQIGFVAARHHRSVPTYLHGLLW